MDKIFTKLNIGDVVASSGGKCFKKLTTEQPQDDSIVGTWVFNETISFDIFGHYYIEGIISTGYSFTEIFLNQASSTGDHWMQYYLPAISSYVKAYTVNKGWGNTKDRTITISGGSDISNSGFISWLKANAIKVS